MAWRPGLLFVCTSSAALPTTMLCLFSGVDTRSEKGRAVAVPCSASSRFKQVKRPTGSKAAAADNTEAAQVLVLKLLRVHKQPKLVMLVSTSATFSSRCACVCQWQLWLLLVMCVSEAAVTGWQSCPVIRAAACSWYCSHTLFLNCLQPRALCQTGINTAMQSHNPKGGGGPPGVWRGPSQQRGRTSWAAPNSGVPAAATPSHHPTPRRAAVSAAVCGPPSAQLGGGRFDQRCSAFALCGRHRVGGSWGQQQRQHPGDAERLCD